MIWCLFSRCITGNGGAALNMRIERGNTLSQHQEFYRGSYFVEYHFSGFEEQYGDGWQSLRLVFVERMDLVPGCDCARPVDDLKGIER